MKVLIATFLIAICTGVSAQNPNLNYNKFRQLGEEIPTPNSYRTASGAPGHEYYQQRADYVMNVRLDEESLQVSGEEQITYYNNSPDALDYLWLQLDQNLRSKDSDTYKTKKLSFEENISLAKLNDIDPTFDGGFKLEMVVDNEGNPLNYIINRTMMRIDLDKKLEPGQQFTFNIEWFYNINDRVNQGGRSGYEYFEEEDNYLFAIGQFYPRMAVYNEVEGWQHKQFLGRAEFATVFGNFDVSITVPSDHLVAATGTLQNPDEVLTEIQQQRLEKARSASEPVLIVTEDEARKNEKGKAKGQKTWHFKAENVRDFAWASSRKHIWDAWGLDIGGKIVMAMSMYPKESNPLWEQYSTKTIAHTLKHYSDYLFHYPYPVAWSVHGRNLGMEYPMICFNWGRSEEDDTYTSREKYFLIGVIIHEIGHNWFPMIVNSDERRWAWMDESVNSLVQYVAEKNFQRDFPSRRGEPYKLISYMKSDKSKMMPIMTNPESIPNLGWNTYNKATTALNILRESILGRELFDYAIKVYANRWKFKHPTPADFFRTMEDASGTDLDWFWRGWFYTTDHVDLSLDKVTWYKLNSKNPEIEKPASREENERKTINITDIRNADDIDTTYVERDPALEDFYSTYDEYDVTSVDREKYEKFKSKLSEEELAVFNDDLNYYELTLSNIGGLPMPVILEFEFKNGNKEIRRIAAEIWRYDDRTLKKIFAFDEEVISVSIDPFGETADTDLDNNFRQVKQVPSRFELYIRKTDKTSNPMQLEEKNKQLLDKQ